MEGIQMQLRRAWKRVAAGKCHAWEEEQGGYNTGTGSRIKSKGRVYYRLYFEAQAYTSRGEDLESTPDLSADHGSSHRCTGTWAHMMTEIVRK